jgi:hypothetical protein
MGWARPPRHSARSGPCPGPIRRRPAPRPARSQSPAAAGGGGWRGSVAACGRGGPAARPRRRPPRRRPGPPRRGRRAGIRAGPPRGPGAGSGSGRPSPRPALGRLGWTPSPGQGPDDPSLPLIKLLWSRHHAGPGDAERDQEAGWAPAFAGAIGHREGSGRGGSRHGRRTTSRLTRPIRECGTGPAVVRPTSSSRTIFLRDCGVREERDHESPPRAGRAPGRGHRRAVPRPGADLR